MFQQLSSFDVVCPCRREEGGQQPGTKARTCCVGLCMGCGKVAGMFVASLFSLLCRGLQHRHLLNLQSFSDTESTSADHSESKDATFCSWLSSSAVSVCDVKKITAPRLT